MALASTSTQKQFLAYALHRHRPCLSAVLYLIDWLDDTDQHVREEAADAIGYSFRYEKTLRGRTASLAGGALLHYIENHSQDRIHLATQVSYKHGADSN
jgi:hypothetical protein